jgi:predicted nucleic acid-binding protein
VKPERIVFDIELLIARLLLPASDAALALNKALDEAELLISDPYLLALESVLARPALESYLPADARHEYPVWLRRIGTTVLPVPVPPGRHPHDDRVLELALAGKADLIISESPALLALPGYHGIPITAPALYLSAPCVP